MKTQAATKVLELYSGDAIKDQNNGGCVDFVTTYGAKQNKHVLKYGMRSLNGETASTLLEVPAIGVLINIGAGTGDEGFHWICAVILPSKKSIDSFNSDIYYDAEEDQKVLRPFVQWMITLERQYGISPISTERDWEVRTHPFKLQQQNDFDCGLFAAALMAMLATGSGINWDRKGPKFTEEDMRDIRHRMLLRMSLYRDWMDTVSSK